MSEKRETGAQVDGLPYVGPRPFEDSEAERKIFFGREREAQDLLSLVMAERLVLFFAPSGAGKSSLIRARVMTGLRDENFLVMPPTRVGGQITPGNNGQSGENIYVFNLLRDLDQGHTPPERLQQLTLSDYLGQLEGARALDRVLIIDQFEEIVTSYHDQWAKREDFFRQLSQALSDDPHLWVLLAMREDYIAALDPYARLLPGRLRVRYRMSYMSYKAALEAVKGPAALAGRPFEDEAAERLVNNLRQLTAAEENSDAALGEYVEPVQLQVVCLQLWQSLPPAQGKRITLDDLRNLGGGAGLAAFVNNALAAFYEQKLAEVLAARPGIVGERQLRDWFSNVLITKDGTRNLIYQSEVETGGLPNAVVLELERRFLLRAETRAGSKWIELVHDRFIDPILQANRNWRNQSPLIQAAERWLAGKDASLLFAGAALAEAQQQLAAHPERFGSGERDFVAAGLAVEEEQRRQTNLQEERRRREVERSRRVVAGSLAVGGIMVVLAALSIWFARMSMESADALRQTNASLVAAQATAVAEAERASAEADRAARAQTTAEAEAQRADAARRQTEALSRIIRADQLAGNAMLALESRPQTALLLAVEAANVQRDQGEAPIAQAVQGLRDVLGQVGGLPLAAGLDNLQAAAMSDDERWLAVGDDAGQLRVWDLANLAADPSMLPGHAGPIWRVAFAPGSARLASAGADAVVRLWQLDDPAAEPVTLEGHTGDIYSLAFAPDGTQLASGGADQSIRLWEVATGATAGILLGHMGDVNSLAYSPDGRTLASGSSDGSVRLWSAGDPDAPPTALQEGGAGVNVVTYSPDGVWLASGSADGRVGLWNLAEPEATVPPVDPQEFAVFTVAFSPDSRWLASADDAGTVRVTQLREPNQRYILRGHRSNVRGLVFLETPLGLWLASASYDGTVRLWDYRNPERNPLILRGHDDAITILATAPRGSRFATASYDHTVRLWESSRPFAEPNHLIVARVPVGELAVGSNPDRIVSSGVDQTFAQVWDGATGQPLFRLEGHAGAVSALALSPDGRQLVTGGKDATVRTWNALDGAPVLTLTGHTGPVFTAAFSPDGTMLASAGDDTTVRLWDATTGELLHLLEGHAGPVMGVAFSPDGATVASVDREPRPDADGLLQRASARLWDVETGASRGVLDGPADGRGFLSVAYQPGGSWLVAGGEDGKVWVWASDALALDPARLSRPDDRIEINAVGFSDDGRTLASAGTDGLVYVWDTTNPSADPGVLRGHGGSVNAVAFAPGTSAIVTAGADRTIRYWAPKVEQLIAEACTTAGRNLTEGEWTQFIPTMPYRRTCPELPAALQGAGTTAP